jgi:hypothetical protein
MTQGDVSALMNMGDREDEPPIAAGTLHLRVTASVSRIHMVTEIVYDMTRRGFALYDTAAASVLRYANTQR